MELSRTSSLLSGCEENNLSGENNNTGGNGSAITANYVINKTKALMKIKLACDKENYRIECSDFCTSVCFNTVSFVLFQKYINKYYVNHPSYIIDISKPNELKDKNSNVAQDIIRVLDRNKRNNPPVYTINAYRTKCKIMVNGPHHIRFGEHDLPEITKMIDQMDADVKSQNAAIKDGLSGVNDLTNSISDSCNAITRACPLTCEDSGNDSLTGQLSSQAIASQTFNESPVYSQIEVTLNDSDTLNKHDVVGLLTPKLDEILCNNTRSLTQEDLDSQVSKPEQPLLIADKVYVEKEQNDQLLSKCHCNTEDSDEMIQCSNCKRWVHYTCTKLPAYMLKQLCIKNRKYHCELCIGISVDNLPQYTAEPAVHQKLVQVFNKDSQTDDTSPETQDKMSQTEVDVLLKNNLELKSTNDKLEEARRCSELRLQDTLDQLKKLKVSSNVQKTNMEKKEDQLNDISKQLESAKTDLQAKVRGYEMAATQVTKLTKEARKYEDNISSLKQQLKEKDATITNLQKEISVHLDLAETLKPVLNNNNNDENEIPSSYEERLETLQHENESLRNELNCHQISEPEKTKQKNKEITNLRKTNLVLSESLKDAKNELQSTQHQLHVVNANFERERLLNSVMSKQIEQKDDIIKCKEGEIDQMQHSLQQSTTNHLDDSFVTADDSFITVDN